MNTKEITESANNPIWEVRKIKESSNELLEMLDRKELYLSTLQQMTLESRKQEFLTIRVLLKKLLGKEQEIRYTTSGKPYLSDDSYQISISHTRGYVALILDRKQAVGIDIESISPRIRKIRKRFMSPIEEANLCIKQEDIHLLLHWSAKESMFKSLGQENVEFRTQLHIQPFEPVYNSLSTFSAYETRTENTHSFLIYYLVDEAYVLTFCQQ